MSIKKVAKGVPTEPLCAEGFMYHDKTALTDCQKECIRRLGISIQMEQEDYLPKHPEVIALAQMFIASMVKTNKRDGIHKAAGIFFTRPVEDLDQEIREHLKLPPNVPYSQAQNIAYTCDDSYNLEQDLLKIIKKHYPPPPWKVPSPVVTTPATISSSFISLVTSETTLPTPEPEPIPEPTTEEIFFSMISNSVDKAFYSLFHEDALRYDTAYVELQKAVEVAMEVPVIEIRVDIAELLYNAYHYFEMNILDKERIAAEIAWGKRMRKKLKKTLRRLDNFRGYETPPTPKSELSSHPSYLIPPPKPCVCYPQFHYNRYAKDRFGLYLPSGEEFSLENTTTTPTCSFTNIPIAGKEDPAPTPAPTPADNTN